MTKFELDSLDNKDELGNTLLHRAIMDSNPERARARCACLCEVGSDVNLPNHIGDTPLLIAVSMGLVECARCSRPRPTSTANEAGFTPLLIAASDGASGARRGLISRKIELRSADLNEKAGDTRRCTGCA